MSALAGLGADTGPGEVVLSGGRLLAGSVDGIPDDRGGVSVPVDVVLADGRVQSVRPAGRGQRSRLARIGARHLLLVPGLVNGHTHSHEGLYRGRYPRLPLEVWMHFPRSPLTLPLEPEDAYVRTLLSAIEAVRGGATTVVDDVASGNADPAVVDAVARAYTDAGLRALVGPSMLDLPYFSAVPFLEDEMPATLRRELSGMATPDGPLQLERLAALLDRGDPRTDRVSFVAAPSAPQRCSRGFLTAVFALARSRERAVVTHVQETRLQVVDAWQRYGRSAVAELDELGLLGPRVTLIHGVWLTPDDIARLARAGANVQHNPVSNLRLGAGLAALAVLRASGLNVSLGTDGPGSCIATRMTAVVRQAALLSSLRGEEPEDWVSSAAALDMATAGGARALGLEADIGRIAPGMRADVAGFRLDAAPFAPLNDATRQLVYAESPPLDLLLVDGRVLLRDGATTTIDEGATLTRAREIHRRLEPSIARSDAFVRERLQPVYERVHTRTLAEAVPEDLYPARVPPPARAAGDGASPARSGQGT